LHIEEVIIETHVAGCVGRLTLRAIQEKKKSGKSSLSSVVTRHPAAFYSYGIRRQREPDRCDATGRTGRRPIGDQSIGRIALCWEIAECRALQGIEEVIVRQRNEMSWSFRFRVNAPILKVL
jgi:hypothetical protein